MPSDQRNLAGLATGITSADNPFGLPKRSVDDDGLLVWHPAVGIAGADPLAPLAILRVRAEASGLADCIPRAVSKP